MPKLPISIPVTCNTWRKCKWLW